MRQNGDDKMSGTLSERELETVMGLFLFQNVPEREAREMISDKSCTVESFAKGSRIYSGKSFRRSLGTVLQGEINVTKMTADGGELPINILRAGDVFGAAALFNDEDEFATVLTAARDCRVIFFPQELVRRGFAISGTIAENYIRYLSGRIIFLNQKIFSLTAGTAERRLSTWLIKSAEEGSTTELTVNMTQLAGALDIGRASLYRAMDELEDRGAIKKISKKIQILDMKALRDIQKGRT
jgi:CRP-like cAMP-binding protein